MSTQPDAQSWSRSKADAVSVKAGAGRRRRPPPQRIVLISGAARRARNRLDALELAGFQVVERFDLDKCQDDRALVAGVGEAWASIAGTESYTRRLFRSAPNLAVVARCGVGYDAIDVEAATDEGVAILTTPGANANSVADFTVLLMLACIRRLRVLDEAVRAGCWRPPGVSGDLTAATIGIIGLGNIGRAVAKRLRGFDCTLLAVEPKPDAAECMQLNVEVVPLDDLLTTVDVVTLHVPSSPDTRPLLGEQELALLRPGAVLVNTSRGDVIDEPALVRALDDGRIAAAGLDVFASEPLPQDHPLTSLRNVVLTGHMASLTAPTVERMLDQIVRDLMVVSAGTLPDSCVNPAAWEHNHNAGP